MTTRRASRIYHEGFVVLEYTFKPTPIVRSIELLKDVIKKLDSNRTGRIPSNNYACALKYREELFNLKDLLYTYVERVFKKFQTDLITEENIADDVITVCRRKFYQKDKISHNYDFTDWDNNVWILAKFFSPTLARNCWSNPPWEIDLQSLLEILEQFRDFGGYVRICARIVKHGRNTLYAHLSAPCITSEQYRKGCFQVNKLFDCTINDPN